jgi:mono/diheme cytochrome c family protein
MPNGWICSRTDRNRLVVAALGVIAALAAAFAIWIARDPIGPAELFRTRCSTCHGLPDLSRFHAADLAGIVRTMRDKNGADKVISDDEARAIVRYLEETAGK